MLPRLTQQKDGMHVFEILEQRNVTMLFQSIKVSSKSAQQLAIECNIPLSTTYRIIGKLTRLNFIKTKHIFNESGKWEKMYRYNGFFIEHIRNENVSNELTNSKGNFT
jgi:ABC-type Zn uptake system ZnuABC Zn-binding protein ZnuA